MAPSLKLLFPIFVAFGTMSPAISVDYMTTDDIPTPGPEKDTVYQPGTPGGDWDEGEVASTKRRIMQLIDPDWKVKVEMGVAEGKLAFGKVTEKKPKISENSENSKKMKNSGKFKAI